MSESDMPRLLAFYKDAWDDDGTAVGWRTIAWGLGLRDGSAVTVAAEGTPAVTLWRSVADAADTLDAYVDSPSPRRHRPAAPRRGATVRAVTTTSPGSSDGTAARPACPDAPPPRGTGDRPPGDPASPGSDRER